MTSEQRTAMQVIVDLQRRLELTEHRHHNELGKLQTELHKARRKLASQERIIRRLRDQSGSAEPVVVQRLHNRLYQARQRAEHWKARALR